jgi:hypothetical protein
MPAAAMAAASGPLAASVSAAMACSIAASDGRSNRRCAAVAAPGRVHRCTSPIAVSIRPAGHFADPEGGPYAGKVVTNAPGGPAHGHQDGIRERRMS